MFSLEEIMRASGCECITKDVDPSKTFRGVAPIETATFEDVTFVASPAYTKYLATTKAGIVITSDKSASGDFINLYHENPNLAYALVSQKFHPRRQYQAYCHPSAVIADGVQIGKDVHIMANVVVGAGTKIADQVVVFPNTYIGENVSIDARTEIKANVTIEDDSKIGSDVVIHAACVIGSDGFGYAIGKNQVEKIPQFGLVVIEDHVELGSGVTIDRGAMGETRIGKHTKLDSKVHIGHNVRVGAYCLFSGFVGIAGSVTIGDRVILGGHVGIADHLSICSDVMIGGKSGVAQSIKKPGIYMGYPAIPMIEWKKSLVYSKRLPKLFGKS